MMKGLDKMKTITIDAREFEHFKKKTVYAMIGRAKHHDPEVDADVIVYMGPDGQLWYREPAQFFGEKDLGQGQFVRRFKPLDDDK
jgi:hypothetical protein